MGNIYFIAESGSNELVKIGKSVGSVEKRLVSLQCGNPRRLYVKRQFSVENHTKVESSLHKIFRVQRVFGEWFKFSGKIERFLDHVDQYGFNQTYLEYTHACTHPKAMQSIERGEWVGMATSAPNPNSEKEAKRLIETLKRKGIRLVKTRA